MNQCCLELQASGSFLFSLYTHLGCHLKCTAMNLQDYLTFYSFNAKNDLGFVREKQQCTAVKWPLTRKNYEKNRKKTAG